MTTERPADPDARDGEEALRRGGIVALLTAGNTSRLLYGAVVAAAVLAVVEGRAWGRVVIAIAAVLVIYWLAHVYVESLAHRLHQPSHRGRFRRAARHEAPILLGGIPAMIVVAAATLLGASVATATGIALWATVALLAGTGYVGAHRAGRTGWRLFADVIAAALFGVLAVVLKTLLH